MTWQQAGEEPSTAAPTTHRPTALEPDFTFTQQLTTGRVIKTSRFPPAGRSRVPVPASRHRHPWSAGHAPRPHWSTVPRAPPTSRAGAVGRELWGRRACALQGGVRGLRGLSWGGMFRRPPRNFRGRRRAASSGSSDEQPEPAGAVLPPAPGLSAGSEQEAEPEEGEGDPGSAAACPQGTRAAAAEESWSPEEPAGSPERKEATGRGARFAGAGPARGGGLLLSFGGEEEREGKGSAASLASGGPAQPHPPRGGRRPHRGPPAWRPARQAWGGAARLGARMNTLLLRTRQVGSGVPASLSHELATRRAASHLYGSL